MTNIQKAYLEMKSMPPNIRREVIDFIEFLKFKEELQATMEVLADKKLMKSIKGGIKAIRQGKIKPWSQVKKHV